jgi:hypothetical protein
MKPNRNEDEYIWVQELQQRMAKLEKEQQAESEAEKLRLKEAHWMHCPKCGQNGKREGRLQYLPFSAVQTMGTTFNRVAGCSRRKRLRHSGRQATAKTR